MPAQIEKLPGEPILIINVDTADFSPESARAFEKELQATLDTQQKPVVLINIIPEDYQFSIDDLVEATQLVKQQSHIYHHPNIKGMAAVTTNEALQIAHEGLSDETFGNIDIRAFDTLDEALNFARS
jgi:hypothetical protein